LSNCGTTPTRARATRARLGIGSPHRRIVPASGEAMPSSMRNVVVLPAPFGPSRPKHSPASTWNDSPSTTVFSP
jgi:hypothetical protein